MNLSLIRLARRVVGLIGIALFAVLVGFSLLTHIAPLTGYQLFIVGGGSMEPSIPIGSLVVVSQIDASSSDLGDVITIRADNGVVVTHRVIRVVHLAEGRFYETKGDANQGPDGSLVPARALVGTAGRYVPFAGYAQEYLSTVPGIVAALSALGALALIYRLLEMLERSARGTLAQARETVGP
jgi:signal peptidase I, archaeal type